MPASATAITPLRRVQTRPDMQLIHFEDVRHGHVFVNAKNIVGLAPMDTGSAIIVEAGDTTESFHVTTDVQELASLIERFVSGSEVIYLM